MDDVIQELIHLDQRARETVKLAENSRDDGKQKIVREKAELHQKYEAEAKHRIARVRQYAQEDSEQQRKEIQQSCEAAQQELGRRFEQHRKSWTEELVQRCLRPGLTQ